MKPYKFLHCVLPCGLSSVAGVIMVADFQNPWHAKWDYLAWVFQTSWSKGELRQESVSIYFSIFSVQLSWTWHSHYLIFTTVFPGFQLWVILVWLSGLHWWQFQLHEKHIMYLLTIDVFLSGVTSLDHLFFLILDLTCWTNFWLMTPRR